MASNTQLADPSLLTKIDKLFECGVGDYIDLPQLVVVGDQSSGKSSVLEGLTKLPFPRASTLCTRFATQITFRRASSLKVIVTIIPKKNASSADQQRLREWRKVEAAPLNASRFASIMEEVHREMGLTSESPEQNGFSEDTLRIEILGPDEEHFSVVDVPGIFRVPTAGVTTFSDIQMVKGMVNDYMGNPRSVMLAVVPANVDVATQDILTMAEQHDAEGERTIGVLTKPDLVDDGAESAVIDLLEGKSHVLKHGWCIVKNASQKEISCPSKQIDRDQNESRFFKNTAPWNSLDSEKYGISSLRSRLQDILSTHIRREFPKVREEIQRKLNTAEKSLKGLGSQRETADEQREYLVNLSIDFQQSVSAALNTDYISQPEFEEMSVLRLPTSIVARNEVFAKDMQQSGHKYDLGDNPGPICDEPERQAVQVRRFKDKDIIDGVQDIILEDDSIIDVEELESPREWLQNIYKNSRGFELGTFDKNLLATAMRTQSTSWEPLALGYISDIIQMVHSFIHKILKSSCSIPRVREELLAKFQEDLLERYKRAYEQVEFLLQVERTGTPMTTSNHFKAMVEKMQHVRLQEHLEKKSTKDRDGRRVVHLEDLGMIESTLNNSEFIARTLGDILVAYYKVARERFTDAVVNQGAMYHLLQGSDESPLKLFSPGWVAKLTVEDLGEIAGEDPATRRKRAQLKVEVANLKAGKKILR